MHVPIQIYFVGTIYNRIPTYEPSQLCVVDAMPVVGLSDFANQSIMCINKQLLTGRPAAHLVPYFVESSGGSRFYRNHLVVSFRENGPFSGQPENDRVDQAATTQPHHSARPDRGSGPTLSSPPQWFRQLQNSHVSCRIFPGPSDWPTPSIIP